LKEKTSKQRRLIKRTKKRMNPQQHQRGAAAGRQSLFYEPHQVGAMVVYRGSSVSPAAIRLSPGFVAGWLVLLLVGGSTALTVQQFKQYDQIMNTIDLQAEYDAARRLLEALSTRPQGMVSGPVMELASASKDECRMPSGN
jgi:hypothetical protein